MSLACYHGDAGAKTAMELEKSMVSPDTAANLEFLLLKIPLFMGFIAINTH